MHKPAPSSVKKQRIGNWIKTINKGNDTSVLCPPNERNDSIPSGTESVASGTESLPDSINIAEAKRSAREYVMREREREDGR